MRHLTSSRLKVAALLSILLVAAVALAAPPKKKPSPPSEPPVPASSLKADESVKPAEAAEKSRLRVWKTEFPPKREIRLVLRPAGKAAANVELGNFPAGSRFGSYFAAPAGDCTVEARGMGEGAEVLAALAARIPNDAATL